jgi:tetratricopeptide (TPR) repeat protein
LLQWFIRSQIEIEAFLDLQSLGRYQIRGRIGRGTMGVVYRGYDPVLDREIAIKTVDLAPAIDELRRERFLARFFQEAKIAARLLHPGIVVTHDAATDEATGIPFIAMELVPGGSLADRVTERGRIPWDEACRLASHLARALEYAHRQGVVHRDIKPANVLVSTEGVAKIADFGIARLSDSTLTQTGAVMGTPYYMSPEQLEADEVDGRSDLFSLGALLYTILVGEPPFPGSDIASITQKVLYKDPTPPSESVPEIPSAVDSVVARALAKKREERYSDGGELASDLERVGRGESPLRPLSLGERTLEHPRMAAPGPAADPRSESKEKEPILEAGTGSRPAAPFRRLFFVAAVLAVFVYAGIRRDDVTRFVSSRISAAAATIRESREDEERRSDLSAGARRRLEEGRESMVRGRWDEAAAGFEESLRLSRDARDGRGEATALLFRGMLAAETGDWSKARADLESASSVYQIYEDESGRARALLEGAHLERDLGAFDRAESLYDQAAGAKGLEDEVASGRATLALLRGDVASAEARFRAIVQGAVARPERARAAISLGAIAWARGDGKGAETWWSRARDLTDPHEVDLYQGFASLADGKVEDANALFQGSASYFRSQQRGPALETALEGLSGTTAEGRLATVFLGEPRTKRSEARRKLLPAAIAPP